MFTFLSVVFGMYLIITPVLYAGLPVIQCCWKIHQVVDTQLFISHRHHAIGACTQNIGLINSVRFGIKN